MNREKLAEYVFQVMPLINRKLFKRVHHNEIPKQHIRLLHTIYHHDDKPMKFYGARLYISKPNLSKLVELLIQDGYIERHADENDRRVIRLKATDEGRKVVDEEMIRIKKKVVETFAVYSDEDIEQLNYHFEGIAKILDKVE